MNQKPPQIFIARVDDWEALYIDGKCVYQHHSIEIHDLKEYIPNLSSDFYDDLQERVEGECGFPDTLEELESWINV